MTRARQKADFAQGKLVIFDVDGTLFRGGDVSYPAYEKLARLYGIDPPSRELITTFFGRTFDFVAAALGFDRNEQEKRRFIADIERLESESLLENGELYDGAYELLKRLDAQGFKIALCSLGVKSYVETVISKTGIGAFLDDYRFDDGRATKTEMVAAAIEKSGCAYAVMVGDREADYESARENSIPAVGCMYGYAPHEIENGEFLAYSADELYDVITGAFGVCGAAI